MKIAAIIVLVFILILLHELNAIQVRILEILDILSETQLDLLLVKERLKELEEKHKKEE